MVLSATSVASDAVRRYIAFQCFFRTTYLIERGSKVNVKNRYGVSPLLLCAEGGNETLVRLLVSVGDTAPLHTRFAALGEFLTAGDLVVVNTSATVPAAVQGQGASARG